MSRKLKKHTEVPVVIVEDHHDVVQHIYREIGSRHLPMQGLTLVHFDSHPDMLIPLNMPADTVYEKEQLLETLSIENWIVPAVYAGHINHVVWIKPPWCQQVCDGASEFYVGKCLKTGTIRTTCSESYFLSETLYVPEDQLTNKQKLKFTVLTVQPKGWSHCDGVKSDCDVQQADVDSRGDKLEGCVESSETCENTVENTRKRSHIGSGAILSNTEIPYKKGKREDNDSVESQDNSLNINTIIAQCGTSEKDNVSQRDVHANPDLKAAELKARVSKTVDTSELEPDDQSLPSVASVRELSEVLQEQSFILDIDLDFFSTKNPFREMYGSEQYEILKELYKFQRPASLSSEDLEMCSRSRQEQLNVLQEAFSSLEENHDATIVHPRSDLIHKLVSSVQARDPSSVSLLHDAGCTCDDTELPHHVSCPAQITWLVDSVQDLLSYLPKPNMVTIARSSLDDYCPPDQVDSIQEQVLDILQQLFLKIAVHTDYGTDEIEAESLS